MTRTLGSKLGLALAFTAAIAGSSLVTAVVISARVAPAEAQKGRAAPPPPQPTPPPVAPAAPAGSWQISAYFHDSARPGEPANVMRPTNGFVVVNNETGRVANCIANWQGKKEARCYDWSTWVRLP